MNKVIREIMLLLWRVLRTYFWKWLAPRLKKLVFFAVVALAVVGVLTVLVTSSCGG